MTIVNDSMGYKRERGYILEKYGEETFRKVQTCHVIDVKRSLGLGGAIAPNRISPDEQVKPCPDHLRPYVEEAVRHVHKLNG